MHEGGHEMQGLFGPYPMSREASGTSWQPEDAPHEGVHWSSGAWMADRVLRLESTYRLRRHTVFARGELAEKDELFDEGPFEHRVFDVGKLSAGYIHDFPRLGHLVLGAGALGSVHFLPQDLEGPYGSRNPTSVMLFLRAELQ